MPSIALSLSPPIAPSITPLPSLLLLKAASYLTDPVCKVRESYYAFFTLDHTCKNTAEKVMRAFFLTLQLLLSVLLTPLTAPLGIALRGLVALSHSYLYLEREGTPKTLPDNRRITLLFHNVCWMPGGYSITDGQVSPPSYRLDPEIAFLRAKPRDLILLTEVADLQDADYLSSHLPEHPFIIPVAGIRAVGPSSMLYVASKYRPLEIDFIPFEKGTELTGRAQHSEKGFLLVKLDLGNQETLTLCLTHLQHSEIPAHPQADNALDEPAARQAQLKKIFEVLKKRIDQGEKVVFGGDLNQEEAELEAFFAAHPAYQNLLHRDPSIQGKPTWGGDGWCSALMGKTPSQPLVLDYLFTSPGIDLTTEIVETGYSGQEFRPDALSDHFALDSAIRI